MVRGRLPRESNPAPGQRQRGFVPAFDSDGNENYVRISPKNPMPTSNYLMTDGGVWVPQKGTEDGIAKHQLTGSNVVEKHVAQSVEVSGGSGIGLATIDVSDTESFTFGVKGTSAHDFEVKAQRQGYAIGYLDHSVNDRLDVMSITSKTTALSDKFDVTSPLLRFFISNNGIDTQVYDATLYKIGSQVMGE